MGEIEWGICYLKKRSRCVVSKLFAVGIQYVPKPMVICIVYNVTTCVNAIPDSLGVSDKYSPRKIVIQRKFDFAQDCKVQFGAYVEASDDAIVTNTMKLRTHGCVELGTPDNW